jgi:hypothetical protein
MPTRSVAPVLLATVLFATVLLAACSAGPDGGLLDEASDPCALEGEGKCDSVLGSYDASIDVDRPTHVVAIGYSHGQGYQFVHAAAARALRYRELYPADQIVFIASPEVGSSVSDTDALLSVGITIIDAGAGASLSGKALLSRMEKFSQIRSFDFYGHSSPWGLGLEYGQARLGTDTSSARMKALADNFTADASATLNGCNAGIYAAPYFASTWRIPVTGAVTSSNFARPHSARRWYVNDPGRSPAAGKWLTTNDLSYLTPVPCSKGACLRLHPEDAVYNGYWGSFGGGGLGFYKAFCGYQGSAADCARRLARGLLSYPSEQPIDPSSTPEAFAEVLLDFLCPTTLDLGARKACRDGIVAAVADRTSVYSPFNGNTVDCSLTGCGLKLNCSKDWQGAPVPGTCKLLAPANLTPKAYVEEYLLYMDGFAYLTGEEPLPPDDGVIDMAVLATVDRYRINALGLNCRQGAGTEFTPATVLAKGQTVWAEAGVAAPRVVTASTGRPWIRVRRGQGAPACYVSASYKYVTPVAVAH